MARVSVRFDTFMDYESFTTTDGLRVLVLCFSLVVFCLSATLFVLMDLLYVTRESWVF